MKVILHAKSTIVEDIPGFVREGVDPLLLHDRGTNPRKPHPQYADADLTAEQAGRMCYDKRSFRRPNPQTAANQGYLLNIQNEKHFSVLGHGAATLYIEGISRNCTHEIIRHRWFTFSEVSQRYVDMSEFSFALHPGLVRWLDTDAETDQGREDMMFALDRDARDTYNLVVDDLITHHGYSRKEARQAARHVLPSGMETKIFMSGNLRAWRDFLDQRLSLHADVEIREVALAALAIMKENFPNTFQDFDSYGRITVERLIKRAQTRRDAVFAMDPKNVQSGLERFSRDVDEIMAKGLWVLATDPWDEKMEEVESHAG